MQSRRDQLQAYQFQRRRAVAALLLGAPDVAEPPMRRLTLTTIAGLMVAAILAAGFAIVGLIRPATTAAWRQPGTVIVERETGARYLLVDGALHPVLNYASALLALGQPGASVAMVARAALREVPRGPAIGIAGLPDSLPAPADLVPGPWLACSQARRTPAHVAEVTVSLTAGEAAAALIDEEAGVLVSTSDGSREYLLYEGRRLLLGADAATALQLGRYIAVPVGTAFLNAVPEGVALDPAVFKFTKPDPGAPALTVGDKPVQVGQVIKVSDSEDHYVMLSTGLVPVPPLDAALLAIRSPQLSFDSAAIQKAKKSSAAWPHPAGWPDQPPAIAPGPERVGAVCARYAAGAPVRFAVPADAQPLSQPIQASADSVLESGASAAGVADSVRVARGSAAIVCSDSGSEASACLDSDSAAVYLIAAPGVKFPMQRSVLPILGYDASAPSVLPAQFLQLVPTGPAFDRDAALREVPVTAPAPSPSPS
ncbi:MAG: type VII secretion protein EccB [Frankiaceae bacterium]|jgi:type VII secretion protein EccB|nr:type VII secretion protein EccB [Frankiaceae bacterium]